MKTVPLHNFKSDSMFDLLNHIENDIVCIKDYEIDGTQSHDQLNNNSVKGNKCNKPGHSTGQGMVSVASPGQSASPLGNGLSHNRRRVVTESKIYNQHIINIIMRTI